MKIKKGDTVTMMGGKDKGKIGKVLRVLPQKDSVVVEGLNIVKKHRRPRRAGEKGQRVEFPKAVRASRVMVTCPQCGKPVRIGFIRSDNNARSRRCTRCNATFV